MQTPKAFSEMIIKAWPEKAPVSIYGLPTHDLQILSFNVQCIIITFIQFQLIDFLPLNSAAIS